MKVGLIMTKKETKKNTDSKSVKNKEDKKELNMDFSINSDFLNGIGITVVAKSIEFKDTKTDTYVQDQINDILSTVGKIEGVQNGDKIITMAQRFSSRLEKIFSHHKYNSLDKLRGAGIDELKYAQTSLKSDDDISGNLQLGKSSKASWTSLLSRVSKMGTVLYHKKNIFTVEKNSKGKLQVFTLNKFVNPEVRMYEIDSKKWKTIPNPDGNTKVSVSGDYIERIYQNEISTTKKKSKVTKDPLTTSPTEEEIKNGGATAGTVSDDFEMLCKALHFMNGGKDAKLFAEQTVTARFDKVVGIPHDPSKILLDRKNLLAIIDWLKIYAQQLANNEYCIQFTKQDEKQQKAFKQTLQDITELGIGRLGETLKAKQA